MRIDLGFNLSGIIKSCQNTKYINGLVKKSNDIWKDSNDNYCLFLTNGKILISTPIELDLTNELEVKAIEGNFQDNLINIKFLEQVYKIGKKGILDIHFNENDIQLSIKDKKSFISMKEFKPEWNDFPKVSEVVDDCLKKINNNTVKSIGINPDYLVLLNNAFNKTNALKIEFTGENGAMYITPKEKNNANDRCKALLMPVV